MEIAKRLGLVSLASAALIFASTASIAGKPENPGKPKFAEKIDATIAEFATTASEEETPFDSNGADFDILLAALEATGVGAIFDGTDYTVFAPNDQAFYDLTETSDDQAAFNAVVGLLGVAGVADVLAYHVAEGVRNSRSVTRAKQIEMLDGNTISGRTASGLIKANFSEAGLLDVDNRLADGMVHIIDTVLLPINPEEL